MPPTRLRKKQGIVILLDALGASEYSEEKIKKFLSARTEINSGIADLARSGPAGGLLSTPSIYTFGDTIVITIQFKGKKKYGSQIVCAALLMRRYLFHSLEQGILVRGSFAIGSYIEDSESNTVMGEAITDAAQWYEKADWMGVASTPRTNSALEFYVTPESLSRPKFLHKYSVPLKGGSALDLYSIAWPGVFHDETILKHRKKANPRTWFLEIFKDFSFPASATSKYENTKRYFDYVASQIANSSLQGTLRDETAHRP